MMQKNRIVQTTRRKGKISQMCTKKANT